MSWESWAAEAVVLVVAVDTAAAGTQGRAGALGSTEGRRPGSWEGPWSSESATAGGGKRRRAYCHRRDDLGKDREIIGRTLK